jgi:hypothetical protein
MQQIDLEVLMVGGRALELRHLVREWLGHR